MIWSIGSNRRTRRWLCTLLRTRQSVTDRQERVAGWDQARYSSAIGLFIGAGALNGMVCWGAVRKGLGTAHVADNDKAAPTDLNRQFFFEQDLFKNKAMRLCRNLSVHGYCGTQLIAHACWGQDVDFDELQPDFVVASVDMQVSGTRLWLCQVCHKRGIPLIVAALSTDADLGYVFVQKPGEACWACALKPEQTKMEDASQQERCPGVPATADIAMVIAGQVLYAIDSVVMARPRDWNFRMLSLSRADFGGGRMVEKRADCPVCGSKLSPRSLESAKAASGVS